MVKGNTPFMFARVNSQAAGLGTVHGGKDRNNWWRLACIEKDSFAPYEKLAADAFREAGAVFLPAAGYRDGSEVNNAGDNGNYWSSSANDENNAWNINFNDNNLNADNNDNRNYGQSVRLVCE